MRQRIIFFLSAPNTHALQLIEEVKGFHLPKAEEDILRLFTNVARTKLLATHVYYRADIPLTETGGTDHLGAPVCGWHEPAVYSVGYKDIEILIDRQTIGEVEIRVWRNGRHEDYPFAKLTFEAEVFTCGRCGRRDVASAVCSECDYCIHCCPHMRQRSTIVREVDL